MFIAVYSQLYDDYMCAEKKANYKKYNVIPIIGITQYNFNFN